MLKGNGVGCAYLKTLALHLPGMLASAHASDSSTSCLNSASASATDSVQGAGMSVARTCLKLDPTAGRYGPGSNRVDDLRNTKPVKHYVDFMW